MAELRPAFSVRFGSLRSSGDRPAGGPLSIVVARDMDIPADSCELELAGRSGVAPGDEAAVELGYEGQTERVFTGDVVEVLPGLHGVRVHALGRMNRLLNLRRAATYEDQTAGAVVRDLIGAAALVEGTVSDGPTLPLFTVDRRASAFVHARGLADRLGYELYADTRGRVMFHAPGGAAKLDAAAGGLLGAVVSAVGSVPPGGTERYVFGQHLVRATAVRGLAPFASVAVGGESPTSGQGDRTAYWLTTNDSDFRGEAGDGDPRLLVIDFAARTKDLADRFAAGRLAGEARRAYHVAVTVQGRPSLELGQDVSIAGAPDDLVNATGYVRVIRHRFDSRLGFLTDVRIAAEADG